MDIKFEEIEQANVGNDLIMYYFDGKSPDHNALQRAMGYVG